MKEHPAISVRMSLHDPAGRVLLVGNRVLRVVRPQGNQNLNAFLGSRTIRQFIDSKSIPATHILSTSDLDEDLKSHSVLASMLAQAGTVMIEHERIPFPSFPSEWPPEMLSLAALLTLDLADRLLDEGLGLKDASPFNILFRGPKPVFVDVLSVEVREPRDPVWLAYSQFMTNFILPQLANSQFGMPLDAIFLTRKDGIRPQEVYSLCGLLQKMHPRFLSLVTLPTWLERRCHSLDDGKLYRKRNCSSSDEAEYLLRKLLKKLRRQVLAIHRRTAPSRWSDYATSNSYSPDQFAAKIQFVKGALATFSPTTVLDVGCNTGTFSALAASLGAGVVAVDSDPIVVSQVFATAHRENLNILPLILNIARPTPGFGWRNTEFSSFLERAKESFDMVLMLAIIHHLIVTDGIPLHEVVELTAWLTKGLAIVEYVSPEDKMFRSLVRGRADLYSDQSEESFETNFEQRFRIVRKLPLGTSRILYLLQKLKS
ncbi:MAG: class I SAM-dependent methyltransferase [Candidatus Korobacteraceae bacterium]